MWPFRTKNRDQPAASKAAETIPLISGPGKIFFSDQETEVIPRLTRDMPDTKLIPLDEDEPNCPRPSPEWLAETKQLTPVASSDVRALAAAHARLEHADWNAERTAVLAQTAMALEQASMDVIAERLGTDDQNLEDWKAEQSAFPRPIAAYLAKMAAEDEMRLKPAAKLERLPSDDPMLSTDHLPEAFWAISRDGDHRVYRTSGGIKSALTQLNWHADGEVWKGVVYWHPVTSDYVDRPA